MKAQLKHFFCLMAMPPYVVVFSNLGIEILSTITSTHQLTQDGSRSLFTHSAAVRTTDQKMILSPN